MTARLLRAVALGLLVALACLWWLLPQGIGRLERKLGQVERDRHDQLGAFSPAEPGASFEVGDGLRTGTESSADVQLSEGPLIKVRSATLVRFRGGSSGAQRVALAHGEVSIFTVQEPVLFETAAGLVRVAAHSRALLREANDRTWVEVILGRAELEWASASSPRVLNAGESASATHAALEPEHLESADAGPPSTRPTHTANTPRAPSADSPATLEELAPDERASEQDAGTLGPRDARGAELPDFTVAAAPLVTIFDAAPPTRLRLSAGKACSQSASLEIESGRSFVATEGTAFPFPVGTTQYRLRCGARLLASGRVRVVNDAGRRAISQTAPTNAIDADGRAYTVLYQTRLPDLTVRWPSAKPNSKSTLVIDGKSGARRFPVSGAQVVLPSGTLIDGEHEFWFEREGSDLRSRATRVEIRFDNATPLARLNEPAVLPTVSTGSGSATVSGVVVTGARVSIRGTRVALDPSGRFSTEVEPHNDERGFAVMVELPHRSVVYFVRRFRAPDATN